jgi:hypothetical protein
MLIAARLLRLLSRNSISDGILWVNSGAGPRYRQIGLISPIANYLRCRSRREHSGHLNYSTVPHNFGILFCFFLARLVGKGRKIFDYVMLFSAKLSIACDW